MSSKYVYKMEKVGQVFISSRGSNFLQRKYHMTDAEMVSKKRQWEEETKDVPVHIKKKVSSHFFNPYRKGIYWAQVQALYLLGANEWHSFLEVSEKTKEIMESHLVVHKNFQGEMVQSTKWERFSSKTPKGNAKRSKDIIGRLQENIIFMQRLNGAHPSGLKLRQCRAAVDIKKVSEDRLPHGAVFYRLSTYDTEEEALPIRDFSEYEGSDTEGKHLSKRFGGRVITKGGVLV